MKLLDKIALNRLISIILNFVLTILKLFKPKDESIIIDNPVRKKWFPNIRKKK